MLMTAIGWTYGSLELLIDDGSGLPESLPDGNESMNARDGAERPAVASAFRPSPASS